MWVHFVCNISGVVINSSTFTGVEYTRYYALFVTLQALIALVIVWRSGLKMGQKDIPVNLVIADQKAA
jgi:hypothetical protein